jgi:transposase-like protein
MGQAPKRYTPEFRRQMVELHRTGRSLRELSKEFGCTSGGALRSSAQQAHNEMARLLHARDDGSPSAPTAC